MGRGLPDISLIEPLAAALGVSVGELFAGEAMVKNNRFAKVKKAKLYYRGNCKNQTTPL